MRPIAEAILFHEDRGGKFFTEMKTGLSLRMYEKKIESDILNGGYFVVSKKMSSDGERRFGICQINWSTGAVELIGSRDKFKTLSEALDQIGYFQRVKIGDALIVWKDPIDSLTINGTLYRFQHMGCGFYSDIEDIEKKVASRELNYKGILFLEGGFYFKPIPYKKKRSRKRKQRK